MCKKKLFCFWKLFKSRKGFTLTELTVTLSILGIMTAISVPSYFSWLPRHRLQTSARQIYDDLNLAKIRAVKDNIVAVAKFSQLNNNYSIFLDANGTWSVDATETKIRENASFENGVSIANITFPFNTIGFNNRGMLPTGAAPGGQIDLTNATGIIMRVSVNTAGNISISQL
jgi:prepilin-type N-terminal cleavage/methylation domain-containing protein